MYSAHHGHIGAIAATGVFISIIDKDVALAAGVMTAIFSHDLLDRLGEGNYGGLKETLLYEVIPFITFFITAWFSDFFIIGLIGYVSGNFIDLIDKKLYLSVFFPEKYPPTKHFKCHRRKPNIKLTKIQTLLFAVVLMVAYLILTKTVYHG